MPPMQISTSISQSVQALLDSRRASIYGFGGDSGILVYLTCLNAENRLFCRRVRAVYHIRMQHILRVRNPFQVVFTVVGFDSVLVVNFGEIKGVWYKGFCYKSVNALDVFTDVN